MAQHETVDILLIGSGAAGGPMGDSRGHYEGDTLADGAGLRPPRYAPQAERGSLARLRETPLSSTLTRNSRASSPTSSPPPHPAHDCPYQDLTPRICTHSS